MVIMLICQVSIYSHKEWEISSFFRISSFLTKIIAINWVRFDPSCSIMMHFEGYTGIFLFLDMILIVLEEILFSSLLRTTGHLVNIFSILIYRMACTIKMSGKRRLKPKEVALMWKETGTEPPGFAIANFGIKGEYIKSRHEATCRRDFPTIRPDHPDLKFSVQNLEV